MKRVIYIMKWLLSKLPLVGGLVEARRQDFSGAISEVSVNVLFSTLPIWLGPIIIWIMYFQEKSLFGLLAENLAQGEFYIYATTMLSPLFYFLWQEVRGAKSFPSGLFISVASSIIVAVSAGLYGARKANVFIFETTNQGNDTTALQLNDAGYLQFSVMIYVITLIIVYVAHVYKNLRLSGAASITGNQTRNFVDDFSGRNHG